MTEASQAPRRMVFHTPYPLNRQASAASGLRPVRMRDAFEELGYEVWEVTGRAKERIAAARRVKHALKAGLTFDFCYSESSTMPTTLTEPHHLPLHPDVDFSLMRALRRAGTRVGLFYRDVFWAFPEYGVGLPRAQKQVALAAYRYDLRRYRTALDVLFLPSLPMRRWVDVPGVRTVALPPGHDNPTVSEPPATGAHLFYVGGLGGHYRFPLMLQAVQELAAEGEDVSLTICTPPAQWEAAQAEYGPLAGGPVKIVHARAAELAPHYAACNIGALLVDPDEYWTFAVPVKLYEYQGAGRPILAAQGSLAGQFVTDDQLGWTIPYTLADAKQTLRRLANSPEEIRAARERVLAHRAAETWRARAEQVARELSRD